ncbi:helix-turn-helix domain-containing protein, partial [Streptomyces sp. NPDC056405]
VLNARVGRARELLETTGLSVDQVARDCGLGTAANLRLHFRRTLDTTPTAYRRTFTRSTSRGPDSSPADARTG